MRSALLVGCLLATGAIGWAQDIDLLDDMSLWSANVDHPTTTMEMSTTADARLAAQIMSDGGEEDYAKLRLMFTDAQDWSRFSRLSLRVRVTCDDPGITDKRMAIVFYDRTWLRQDLPDHPMTQQCITHYVPVGEWMDYRDWLIDGNQLSGIHRKAINHIDIYLYEDSDRPHQFKWEFSKLTLEGVGGKAMMFDTEIYDRAAMAAPQSASTVSIASGDGLSIGFTEAGGIGSVEVNEKPVGGESGRMSGLMVRDVAAAGPPVMVGGKLAAAEGGVTQVGQVESLGLAVDATYRGLGDRIEISGKVRDLRGEDRAVTVYFGLPLDGGPWTWWDSVAEGRTGTPELGEYSAIERGMGYGLYGGHSKYPLGTVSSPERAGLTLGIRMDEPVVHRIGYNVENRMHYIAFDFGLVPETAVDGRSLSEAPFRILLYRSDPAFGMRASLQRYYDYFPQFFEKRVTKEGGWYVWGKVSSTPGAVDAGFGFHWGPDSNEAIKWDNENGVQCVLYIEPELFQLAMGDYDRAPTNDECLERLEKLAAGDEEELAKFEKLGYAHSYVPGAWVAAHSSREGMVTVAKAAVSSATYDARGSLGAGIAKYPWITESQWGGVFACNLDPGISDGKGPFCRDVFIEPGLAAPEAIGAHYDGVGLDSFGGYGQYQRANYRREHFKYSDYPLSFSATDKRPVHVAFMGSVEFVRDLANSLHGRGKIVMSNCSWNATPGWLTFVAPYMDVFGAEATSFQDPDFIRAIARTKSCTDLPYNPRPEWEIPWHMLHGIFPGHGNDVDAMKPYAPHLSALASAGWEPITRATADSDKVQLERFGSGKTVYLVAHNKGNEPVTAQVTVDLKALGLEGCQADNLVTSEPIALQDGKYGIGLGDRGTMAVVLKRQ